MEREREWKNKNKNKSCLTKQQLQPLGDKNDSQNRTVTLQNNHNAQSKFKNMHANASQTQWEHLLNPKKEMTHRESTNQTHAPESTNQMHTSDSTNQNREIKCTHQNQRIKCTRQIDKSTAHIKIHKSINPTNHKSLNP